MGVISDKFSRPKKKDCKDNAFDIFQFYKGFILEIDLQ